MNIVYSIFTAFLLFCLPLQHFGQSNVISDDAKVQQLIERHKSANKDKQSMPGYRIQIYSGSNRQEAVMLRATYVQEHPDQSVYLIYQQPNFKVRTGDFKSKLEAEAFFMTIKDTYPAAFIVPDNIKLPDLN